MRAKPTLSVDGARPCIALQFAVAVSPADRLFWTGREILLLFARTPSTRPRRGSSEPPGLLLLGLGRAPPPQFSISRIPDRGHPLHRSALTAGCAATTARTWGSSRVPGSRNSPTNRPRPQQAAIVVIVYSSLFPITTAHPPPLNLSRVDSAHPLPFSPVTVLIDDSASSTRLILINRQPRWHIDHPVLGAKRSHSTRPHLT